MKDLVDTLRDSYASEWCKSSNNYENLGYYDWCLNSIRGHKRILEIGCGSGLSTLKLINEGHVVVAIDENPFMLDRAEELLSANGIRYKRIKRENFVATDTGYRIDYELIDTNCKENENLLIESNLQFDPNLQSWLVANSPFNAVICWFMGVQGAITANDDVRIVYRMKEYKPSQYRQCVQLSICLFAPQILVEGGIINFIDRSKLFENKAERLNFLTWYKELLATQNLFPFNFCYIDQLETINPADIEGVPIKPTLNGEAINVGQNDRFALTSIIGVKNI